MTRRLIRIDTIDDIKAAIEFYNIAFAKRYLSDANVKKMIGAYRYYMLDTIDENDVPEDAVEKPICLVWYKGTKLSTCDTVGRVSKDGKYAYTDGIRMKNEKAL